MRKEQISGLTAVYKKVTEGYVGYIEEISGVNTQGATLKEVKENLRDALVLILETNRERTAKELAGEKVIKEKISVRMP